MSARHPHTPGPWSIDENVIYADVGPSICTVMDSDAFPCLEEGAEADVQAECDANARLIAAAPTMDEILRRLIKWDTAFPVNGNNGYAGLRELNAIIADAKVAVGDDDL